MIPGIVAQRRGGAPAYTGPLDLVPGAVMAYDQDAPSAAMLGQPYASIRKDSGGGATLFNFDAVTGAAPAAAVTTFLAGAGGLVDTWRDGGGDGVTLTIPDPGNSPVWNASSQGGRPSFSKGASQILLQSALEVSLPNGEATVFMVGRGAPINAAIGYNNGQLEITTATANIDDYTAGSIYGTFTFDASGFFLLEATLDIDEIVVLVNGTPVVVTPTIDGASIAAFSDVLAISSATAGDFQALYIYPTVLSSGNRATLRSNFMTRFGL